MMTLHRAPLVCLALAVLITAGLTGCRHASVAKGNDLPIPFNMAKAGICWGGTVWVAEVVETFRPSDYSLTSIGVNLRTLRVFVGDAPPTTVRGMSSSDFGNPGEPVFSPSVGQLYVLRASVTEMDGMDRWRVAAHRRLADVELSEEKLDALWMEMNTECGERWSSKPRHGRSGLEGMLAIDELP